MSGIQDSRSAQTTMAWFPSFFLLCHCLLFFLTSGFTTLAMSSSSGAADGGGGSCCPPGSHGAPPPGLFDQEPKGSFITVAESTTKTPCYYTTPPPSVKSTKSMILFPDIWGFQSRILKIADWLAAEAQCHVLVCDFFRGETKDDHADMAKWFASVPYEPVVANDVDACMEFLKAKGVTDFGAMGFCWGGWAIAKTCSTVKWNCIVIPHPSFRIEAWIFGGNDVELMQSMLAQCPAVLLMPAGNDPPYIKPDSDEFSQAIVVGNTKSKSIPFPEMAHGWTTRGDMEADPKLKRDVDAALQHTLDCIKSNL